MVTLIRQAAVNGIERQQSAIDWAQRVARYVDGRFGFTNVRVGLEVYGRGGRITWIGDQASLESLAAGTIEAAADAGYGRLLTEGSGLFAPGSLEDRVIVGLPERAAF